MGLGGCEIETGQVGDFANFTFCLESIRLGYEAIIKFQEHYSCGANIKSGIGISHHFGKTYYSAMTAGDTLDATV